ncbi:hypothetical protein GGU11DRAFT_750781 [Lentinula aff. detonsa]|nr:hypothetical protein GGU11DRAFT_750781 [Lentinula aff. detonsa]
MSTTSSPTCPARSPTPVLNNEDADLQAFLAAAQRKAQDKWRRLHEEKESGNVVAERTVVGEKEVIEDVVAGEKEVVPKVEPRPWKVAIKMVAGMPRSREVIPIISIPKKRKVEPVVAESSRKKRKGNLAVIIVDSDSDSLPIPFPNACKRCVHGDQVCRPQPHAPNAVACDRCHVARQSCSFLRKVRKPRARSPPSEAETTGMKEEMRELRIAVEELTGQVRALVCQGQGDRGERGLRWEDRKGKGRQRGPTPETDRYSSE